MLNVSPELIERAVAILGTDGKSSAEIEADVFAMTQDSMIARRLIDWIPEAFGIVFVPHLAKVILPTTFSAKSNSGKWVQFEFQVEPIFASAVRIGMEMYHSGPRNAFSNIALRSSVVAAVNNALNQGTSLNGATLSGPALIGVPAEVYLPQSLPIWRRLFR